MLEILQLIDNAKKYNIILMGIMMPKMDRFETSKLIKEIGNDFIIIALTSIVIEQHSQNFIDAGIKIALTQPINKDELNTNILNQF